MKTAPVLVYQSLETPTETDTPEHVYQKSATDVNDRAEAASDWNVVRNQQSFIDKRLISSKIVLMRVSKPKTNTEHLL